MSCFTNLLQNFLNVTKSFQADKRYYMFLISGVQ